MSVLANNEEIKIFQEYLRIPSVHPDVDYEPCVQFIRRQAESLELPVMVYHPAGDASKPIVVLTWLGSEPALSSILLNSHMDVVPVFEANWTHPPFAAEIDEAGRIFARGSQDMKCVGAQYLAAVRALKRDGVQQLKRTVYIVFVPDEETGSVLGMSKFVPTDDFKAMNVGFALDEGIASPDDVFPVYYAERTVWKAQFNCTGTAGHGSLLLTSTASEKLLYIMTKMSEFRAIESKRLDGSNGALSIGDVTTVNLTILEGGVQSNVVPPLMSVVYDIRLALDVAQDEFVAQLRRWCAEAGGSDVELVFLQKDPYVEPTKIDDSNPFWAAFTTVIVDELKYKIKPLVFPGGTDSRFIRNAGIPAIGFSPINHTPVLLHDHDEFLGAETYLTGIEIYKKLIPRVANV